MQRFIGCLVCMCAVFVFTCIGHAQAEKPFEFALYGGYATGPYDADGGNYGFGFGLDVPIIKEDPYGNMLSGEIFISWNHGEKGYTMSVVPLADPANPISVPATATLQTTTVNADLKYTLKNLLPNMNLYGLAGVGVYIYEVDYDLDVKDGQGLPAEWTYVGFSNGSVLGVAGPAYPAGEEMPFGWAHTDFGFQVGTGLDYYILPFLSLGIDYRYNVVTRQSENNFHQVFSKLAFHF
mgnify:CR=1 FL=1